MGLSVPVSVEPGPAGIMMLASLSVAAGYLCPATPGQGDLPLSPSSAVLKAKLGHQRSGNSDLIFRGRPVRSPSESSARPASARLVQALLSHQVAGYYNYQTYPARTEL